MIFVQKIMDQHMDQHIGVGTILLVVYSDNIITDNIIICTVAGTPKVGAVMSPVDPLVPTPMLEKCASIV